MALKPLKTLNFGGEDTYYLDFKNVENMPFETVSSDTLTWDGNANGHEVIKNMYIKISDVAPTISDFANGFMITVKDLTTGKIESIMYSSEIIITDGALITYDPFPFFLVITEDTLSDDIFFSKGTYFVDYSILDINIVVIALTIPGYTGFTTTTLKTDYVPMDYITEKVLSALPTWSGGEY